MSKIQMALNLRDIGAPARMAANAEGDYGLIRIEVESSAHQVNITLTDDEARRLSSFIDFVLNSRP